MSKLIRSRIPAMLMVVCLTAFLSACSADGQSGQASRPSPERAAAVNKALKASLDLPVPAPNYVAVKLMRKEYDSIEAVYQTNFKNYQQDVLWETPVQRGYDLFFPGNQVAPQYLDAWVKATGSAIAYTARGYYKMNQATAARGTDAIGNTPKENLKWMQKFCDEAAEDLQNAVRLDPDLAPAWVALIRISMLAGMSFTPDEMFEEAIRHDRRSFYIRQQYKVSLQPRWGGAYEAMQGLAEFSLKDLDHNPRFWGLQGDVYGDAGSMYSLQGDQERAVELYTIALEFGDKLHTLQYRAWSLQKLGRYNEAMTDLEKILTYDPEDYEATVMMSRLKQKMNHDG